MLFVCKEEKVSEFRAELLKVKSDRNKQGKRVKALEEENANLKQENGDLKTRLQEANTILTYRNTAIKALAKEKEELKLSIEQLEVEVEEGSARFQNCKDNLDKMLHCTLCDYIIENDVHI